jgi:hypothetical protein
MYVLLLLLALSAIYCFAVFRWTRHLPVWLRLLTQSFLLCLLCPTFVVQEDGAAFAPTIVYLSFYLGDLKPDQIEELIFQILFVWGVVYGLWLATIGICRPHSEDPVRLHYVKLAALICSLPSWVLGACFILYRVCLDGRHWPYLGQFAIPCMICFVCSMAAMTMFLISMNDRFDPRSDILLFSFSAFPICLAMFLVCLLWFYMTFGDTTMEDIFGY